MEIAGLMKGLLTTSAIGSLFHHDQRVEAWKRWNFNMFSFSMFVASSGIPLPLRICTQEK